VFSASINIHETKLCSQSRPTHSASDCYVTENYHIRHAHLQHVFYFTLDVRTALLYALRLQLETATDSVE